MNVFKAPLHQCLQVLSFACARERAPSARTTDTTRVEPQDMVILFKQGKSNRVQHSDEVHLSNAEESLSIRKSMGAPAVANARIVHAAPKPRPRMQQDSQFVFLSAFRPSGSLQVSFKRYTGGQLDEHYIEDNMRFWKVLQRCYVMIITL